MASVTLWASAAAAQDAEINIPPQSLATALYTFADQSGHQVMFSPELAGAKTTVGVSGVADREQALRQLLQGTGLTYQREDDTFLIVRAGDPQSGSAAGDGADGTVEALIVTAQKREEDIQDVPIAISAFTQEQLERSQVAGGPDLITQVPNMTFTKTNFSSYSIQLRGIGTQAISATVDPAVAVAFNNTPFIRNRFFEQEFYDLQRVEVLRGPQGTLYGRNATAGVVNLISQKARLGAYEAKLSGDVANYNSTRLEGMINIPLAEEVAALRIAGAWTKREGYTTNELSGEPIDGRDLWSTRVSLRLAPTDRLDANLIWEHFEEDDDRLRSGKQLCKTDIVEEVAGFPTPNFYQMVNDGANVGSPLAFLQGNFSQGCKPASLYSPESFQKTNPLALPYYVPLGGVGLPISQLNNSFLTPLDPYASRNQSHDLRVIEAAVDSSYRAKTDLVELQVAYDLSDTLTVNSETAWSSDFVFSSQDYNRFAGSPQGFGVGNGSITTTFYRQRGILLPNGEFCDPQIGCTDRLTAMDLSTARSTQFSQELRLASNFDGPFNFSLGGNFLRHDTEDKYYVFINTVSMISAFATDGFLGPGEGLWQPGVTDNRDCLTDGMVEPDFEEAQPILRCTYIDPNPINSLNDLGHNYFLSRNPFKLISYAVFGEAYYNLTDTLKVTAGLRWTVDKKEAPMRPSWLLAANTVGHPVAEVVEQEWEKPTGRLAVDWKPDLAFTDETMVYASYAHGYKAGGMNPPPYGKAILTFGITADIGDLVTAESATHPKTFEAEYIDALELGSKNTLLDGAMTLNLAAFYYDYRGYQLSQIVNRSAVTQNFDAEVWGLELESDWRPLENLRFGLKLGYEQTRVADGEQAIDVMDRTAGDDAWTLIKPFPSIPSNCVVPTWLLVGGSGPSPVLVNVGAKAGGNTGGCEQAYLLGWDPGTGVPYRFNPYNTPGPFPLGSNFRRNVNYPAWSDDLADYPCWPDDPATGEPATLARRDYPGADPACLAALSNNGEGFFKDLSGNELPNAPNFTATITADYTIPLPSDWLATLHTDLYYQSESWWRIFNTEGYDKLKAYTNVNLAAIFTNEDRGWKVMAYIKNVLDKDHITGAFLNSDDSGLTTNVFLIEPRLYGLRVTKEFTGGPWWTGANLDHTGPFPLTVEIGGQIQQHDAPYETLRADWVDNLPESIAPENVQNRDFDTGDGRSLKLTWKPTGSPWTVSGGVRYGRANNDTTRTNASLVEEVEACFHPLDSKYAFLCEPPFEFYGYYFRLVNYVETRSWSDAEARAREEHQIVDFAVGRDFGLGSGLKSTVSAGLRHAEFQSDTDWAANAQTDWNVPNGWSLGHQGPHFHSSFTRRHVTVMAERTFNGTGPTLSWEAALPVWGDDRTGRLNVDWAVTAGALFGDRETSITGEDETVLHQGNLGERFEASADRRRVEIVRTLPVADTNVVPIDIRRTEDATVPLLDLSLGLSYDVGRIKVGAGYRWERYFDVLDVGQDEAREADRTIDGPYFKFALGFGG